MASLIDPNFKTPADFNFGLQDACADGDAALASKLLYLAEFPSVTRSLKKAAAAGSVECLGLLFGRIDAENAMDRFDLAIALWWAAGAPATAPKSDCFKILAARAEPDELAWALRELCASANAGGAAMLLEAGADPDLAPRWPRNDASNRPARQEVDERARQAPSLRKFEQIQIMMASGPWAPRPSKPGPRL